MSLRQSRLKLIADDLAYCSLVCREQWSGASGSEAAGYVGKHPASAAGRLDRNGYLVLAWRSIPQRRIAPLECFVMAGKAFRSCGGSSASTADSADASAVESLSSQADWEQRPSSYVFTLSEVAAIFRCSQGHILNAIRRGRLAALKLEGKGHGVWRIEKRSLVAYLGASKYEPRVDRAGRRKSTGQAGGSLLRHLDPVSLRGALPQQGAYARPPGVGTSRSSGRSRGRGAN